MTIRTTKNQQIGAMAAKDVRDILKKIYEHGLFNERRLTDKIYWLRTSASSCITGYSEIWFPRLRCRLQVSEWRLFGDLS